MLAARDINREPPAQVIERVTPKMVADLFGVTPQAITRRLKRGTIPGEKTIGGWEVDLEWYANRLKAHMKHSKQM